MSGMRPGRIASTTRSRAQELRRNQTMPERRLWKALRELKRFGLHFRRQAPIGPYVVDFACLSAKYVIEVDRHLHGSELEQARDRRRDAFLAGEGFKVLRVNNREVVRNLEGVVETVMRDLEIDVD